MTNHGRDGAPVVRERVTGGLLGILGMLTLGIGFYFLLVRPAMLPEDVRFTSVTPGELPARMTEWLGIVFRTWGGFMAGFGAVLSGVSAYLLTTRRAFLCWGTAIGVDAAFGRFLLSNLAIRSDHVVFIGILFGLALVASLGLILGSRRPLAEAQDPYVRDERTPLHKAVIPPCTTRGDETRSTNSRTSTHVPRKVAFARYRDSSRRNAASGQRREFTNRVA